MCYKSYNSCDRAALHKTAKEFTGVNFAMQPSVYKECTKSRKLNLMGPHLKEQFVSSMTFLFQELQLEQMTVLEPSC
jgi:hypothetical protein